jgi:hypothetical protein
MGVSNFSKVLLIMGMFANFVFSIVGLTELPGGHQATYQ